MNVSQKRKLDHSSPVSSGMDADYHTWKDGSQRPFVTLVDFKNVKWGRIDP